MSEILTAIAIWCQPIIDVAENQKCRNKIIKCLEARSVDKAPNALTIAQVGGGDTFSCFEKRKIDVAQGN